METVFLFLAPLFIIGGVWSIIFIGFLFALLITLTENENDFWSIIIIGLMSWGFVSFNPTFTLPSIGTALTYVAYYFIAGAVWSVGKWFFFVKEVATRYGEMKLQFFKDLSNDSIYRIGGKVTPTHKNLLDTMGVPTPQTKVPTEFQEIFRKYSMGCGFNGIYSLPEQSFSKFLQQFIPSATKNKSKLVRWIMWWPMSATWTLINDPIRKLANYIFGRLQGVYTKISNKAFDGILG